MSTQDERFSFIVEWYDANAAINRKYQFFFFPKDNTVEMYDIKNHRSFLRRCKADNVKLEDLYIGSSLNVLSRQLKFLDYGDDYTCRRLSMKEERTLGIVKPHALPKLGQIMEMIAQNGFLITNMKMVQLDKAEAQMFYEEHRHKLCFNELADMLSKGPAVAFELMGQGAVCQWRELIGPTDPADARSDAPLSIRARFGSDLMNNAVHGSADNATAAKEIEFFFPKNGRTRNSTATFCDCTCCVIKPHAVIAGQAGTIINRIREAGFHITALQMFHMEQANAEEFYEVYKGVVQEYPSMVSELVIGPCIALEIRAENAPIQFREMAGPADPEIARHLRPRTLRAQFGKNKIQNAVHCTDLPEDGLLEVEYFFKILNC